MIEAMKRPLESDYTSHVAYTRALEQYCNGLESQEPVEWNEHFLKSLSAWSGLTVEKVEEILNDPRYDHAVEAKLKEKNI